MTAGDHAWKSLRTSIQKEAGSLLAYMRARGLVSLEAQMAFVKKEFAQKFQEYRSCM